MLIIVFSLIPAGGEHSHCVIWEGHSSQSQERHRKKWRLPHSLTWTHWPEERLHTRSVTILDLTHLQVVRDHGFIIIGFIHDFSIAFKWLHALNAFFSVGHCAHKRTGTTSQPDLHPGQQTHGRGQGYGNYRWNQPPWWHHETRRNRQVIINEQELL